jgi:adenylylsulfate kinase
VTGAVVWVTGLPGSGKTTLARAIARALRLRDIETALLDGDELRIALGESGHDAAARDAFYVRLAGLAVRTARRGTIAIVAATANRRAHRDAARAAAPRFVEVHVATPMPACEERDPKGLYAAARAGRAPSMPGVGVPYEPPLAPEVVAEDGFDAAAVARVLAMLPSSRRAARRGSHRAPGRAWPRSRRHCR